MATATELINESLAILGTYDAGGSPSSAELADSLRTLNFMRSSLAADEEFQTRVTETFSIVASTTTYDWVLSSAALFNSQRPIKIINAYVTFNDLDFPLRGLSRMEADGLIDKNVPRTGIPELYFWDKGYATGTLNIYPAPQAAGTITLATVKEPSALALSSTVSEPGEILEALIWNLSVRLAPKYGIKVTPEIAANSMTSMQRAKRSRMDDTVRVRGDVNFFGGRGARI